MEPIVVLPANELERLITRYEQAVNRLIEADRELADLKNDGYVDYDWICQYLDVSRSTAMLMLAEEKLFVYGRQIKRFRRSAIIRFAEKYSIKVKDVPS